MQYIMLNVVIEWHTTVLNTLLKSLFNHEIQQKQHLLAKMIDMMTAYRGSLPNMYISFLRFIPIPSKSYRFLFWQLFIASIHRIYYCSNIMTLFVYFYAHYIFIYFFVGQNILLHIIMLLIRAYMKIGFVLVCIYVSVFVFWNNCNHNVT